MCVFCRKRVLAVLQEMLALPQTPSSLVSLLTEKLIALIPDDHRRIQTVRSVFIYYLCFFSFLSIRNETVYHSVLTDA